MIVDTSALVAIILGERGWPELRDALLEGPSAIPAPALTELHLVAAGRDHAAAERAEALVANLLGDGLEVVPFALVHAQITRAARELYGKGNGQGGSLNFGDLIVYAVAKDRDEPLLCTGGDFSTTDLAIHPASRIEPA